MVQFQNPTKKKRITKNIKKAKGPRFNVEDLSSSSLNCDYSNNDDLQ